MVIIEPDSRDDLPSYPSNSEDLDYDHHREDAFMKMKLDELFKLKEDTYENFSEIETTHSKGLLLIARMWSRHRIR